MSTAILNGEVICGTSNSASVVNYIEKDNSKITVQTLLSILCPGVL